MRHIDRSYTAIRPSYNTIGDGVPTTALLLLVILDNKMRIGLDCTGVDYALLDSIDTTNVG
jgi:hypothetical protein